MEVRPSPFSSRKCPFSHLTPIGKPPPLAVRLAEALPFRRVQGIEERHTLNVRPPACIRISNALFATPPRGHRRVAAATWWCVPVFPLHLRNNISLAY